MNNQSVAPADIFADLLRFRAPSAVAWIRDGASAPAISSLMKSRHTPYGGVLVEAEIFSLPNKNMPDATDFYAMHIRQNGDYSDNFANTREHYNPTNTTYPSHAGDMVPLLGNEGYAWTAFYSKHSKIEGVLGRSVVIHSHPDDFAIRPSGNSGGEVVCGTVMKADYTDQV